MTESAKRALKLMEKLDMNLDVEALGFVLTVLRDNTKNDEVYKILNQAVKDCWDNR